MRMRVPAACWLLALLAGTPPAGAADTMLAQKQALAERLLASRGGAAAMPEADALIDGARAASAAGDLGAAERLLDRAMRLVAAVRPPPEASPDAERRRYNELLERIAQYRGSFDVDMRSGDATTPLDQGRLDALMAAASAAARAGRYPEAADRLAEAAAAIEAVITANRDGQSVVSALVFATPADEFQYEVNRHRSYVLLVQQAIAEGRADGVARRVAALEEDGARTRSGAEKAAASGDFAAAIRGMEAATRHLVRALQTMGLPIPE